VKVDSQARLGFKSPVQGLGNQRIQKVSVFVGLYFVSTLMFAWLWHQTSSFFNVSVPLEPMAVQCFGLTLAFAVAARAFVKSYHYRRVLLTGLIRGGQLAALMLGLGYVSGVIGLEGSLASFAKADWFMLLPGLLIESLVLLFWVTLLELCRAFFFETLVRPWRSHLVPRMFVMGFEAFLLLNIVDRPFWPSYERLFLALGCIVIAGVTLSWTETDYQVDHLVRTDRRNQRLGFVAGYLVLSLCLFGFNPSDTSVPSIFYSFAGPFLARFGAEASRTIDALLWGFWVLGFWLSANTQFQFAWGRPFRAVRIVNARRRRSGLQSDLELGVETRS
jgi:hypothetical protein